MAQRRKEEELVPAAPTPFRPDMGGEVVRHGMTRFTRIQAWSRAPSPDTEIVNIGWLDDAER